MTYILVYLLKVSLAISLVTIPYYLWLRQDAALNMKRFYMTGGIIMSWLFPLIVIKKPAAITSFTEAYFIDPYAVAPSSTSVLPDTAGGFSNSIFTIVLSVYILGFFFLALRNLFMFRKLNLIDRQKDNRDRSIIYTNSKEIFTLFSKIFIPNDLKSSKDLKSILIHEKAHLQQLHMIDLIIAETNLLLTWFNPFSWLISRMIKENHEHLADRTVLAKGVNPAHYKAQLLNHTMGVELFRLGNQFNHSLTKKRFQMMKKIKSPKKGFIKYLALVPAIVIALGMFTAANAQQNVISGKVVLEDGSPVPGSSIVVAGTTQGTVSDLEGRFTIKIEGNPKLVVSFVGYKSVKGYAKDLARKDIVLYPKAYEIDLKDVKAADSKADKLIVKSEKVSGEAKRYPLRVSSEDDENEPIYVIDGKIVDDIESLDPDKIKSISVIKNKESLEALKYKAEHGVILISTKENDKTKLKSEEKKADETPVFYIVEDMPSFPGGKGQLKAYIIENLEYPAKAKEKKLSGIVKIQVTVKTTGELDDITVMESSDKVFDKAAVKLFENMPDWNPGKQRGKAVKVLVNVPVRFDIDQE